MIIFKLIADIIARKKGDLLQDIEDEKEFAPFMAQRWLSMYSPEFANIVNETTNSHWMVLETKQEWYRFFLLAIPKKPNRKINYIKKAKKSAAKGIEKDYIKFLAERLELSQKEIKDYIEMKGLTNTQLKKLLGVNK